MAATVADFVLERLRKWGVDHVFGYPGDGINGLLVAWERAGNRPRFVQSRHEELSAFEAVGYAKLAGRVGVCTATSGPGAIHLLNGLYDAKLDHVPVVAIVGHTERSAVGGSYQQEVDLPALYADVADAYVQTVMVPEQLPNVLDRAFRIAATRRTVTAVIIPNDVQELAYSAPTHAFKMVPSSLDLASFATLPGPDDLHRAANVLNAGDRVAILVGQGARGAVDEITQVAEILQAGLAKALLGLDVLTDELPYVTGAIGLLGTRPSWELMRDCDTLLVVGSNLPYSQFLPDYEQARGIQIDVDPTMVGLRYPFEVNLVGDARGTLAALLPILEHKTDTSWREGVEANVARWREVMSSRALVDADPVNPELVVHELSPQVPDNAIVTTDSGSSANWYARHLLFRGTMRGTLSGTLATMGNGLPYLTGAKFAYPDRPGIGLIGDGTMQMNGLNELITIADLWPEWEDPRLVIAVFANNDLNQVTWELRAMGGSPQFLPSQRLPTFPYAEYARGLGLVAQRVDEPGDVRDAWTQALRADRPCLLEFVTDPAVPPIPPAASWDQIQNAAMSVARGDSDRWNMVRAGVKAKVQEFLPKQSDPEQG